MTTSLSHLLVSTASGLALYKLASLVLPAWTGVIAGIAGFADALTLLSMCKIAGEEDERLEQLCELIEKEEREG